MHEEIIEANCVVGDAVGSGPARASFAMLSQIALFPTAQDASKSVATAMLLPYVPLVHV